MNTTFQRFHFLWIQIQWHFYKYCKNIKLLFLSDVICMSAKSYFFSFLNKKQWPNPSMMYFIPKLYIQNNLSNTTKCENKCFFFFFYIQIQWEKLLFSFVNKKQWPNLSMVYFILKLCIQNNLSNTTKCENKCFFFLYSNSGFEYRIKKMKIGYITFWNQPGPKCFFFFLKLSGQALSLIGVGIIPH